MSNLAVVFSLGGKIGSYFVCLLIVRTGNKPHCGRRSVIFGYLSKFWDVGQLSFTSHTVR